MTGTVANFVRLYIESDLAGNKTIRVRLVALIEGGWVCEVSDGIRVDTINNLDEWREVKYSWVNPGPDSADTIYGCFHVYLLFSLWGSAICAVLGGIVLTSKVSVLGGLAVLLPGIVALCVLPFFFLWIKKQGRAVEYVIGGVVLILIVMVMLNVQSHFTPN